MRFSNSTLDMFFETGDGPFRVRLCIPLLALTTFAARFFEAPWLHKVEETLGRRRGR